MANQRCRIGTLSAAGMNFPVALAPENIFEYIFIVQNYRFFSLSSLRVCSQISEFKISIRALMYVWKIATSCQLILNFPLLTLPFILFLAEI